jgi:hypothetical protein
MARKASAPAQELEGWLLGKKAGVASALFKSDR